MFTRFVAVSLLTMLLSGYASERVAAGSTPGFFMPAMADRASFPPVATLRQKVYWTLFADASYPQLQIARAPMSAASKAANIHHTRQNDLLETSGVAFDSAGRLWILSFGKVNGDPTSVLVFDLPITRGSLPLFTFVLSGTVSADALAFDPSGDLWVASPGNQSVMEYTGPFTGSATLTPATTLASGINDPFAVAVDKSGDVYISNNGSTGSRSIAVVIPPYTGKPYFLNGLVSPGGLVFDNVGNLYASSNGSTPAIVRYNSNHLKRGDMPSIVDSAGLQATTYEASFAFTSNGDLYAANCGNNGTAGIQVWPLGSKKFKPTLSPSVSYTNSELQSIGCAWGLAIK